MVVSSALSFVDVDDAVQVGEVAVQVDSLGITAPHEPVLNLPWLGSRQGSKGQTSKEIEPKMNK